MRRRREGRSLVNDGTNKKEGNAAVIKMLRRLFGFQRPVRVEVGDNYVAVIDDNSGEPCITENTETTEELVPIRKCKEFKIEHDQEEYKHWDVEIEDRVELFRRGLMTCKELSYRWDPDRATELELEKLLRMTNPDVWKSLCDDPGRYLNRYVTPLCRRHFSYSEYICLGRGAKKDPCPLCEPRKLTGCTDGTQYRRLERAVDHRDRKEFMAANKALVKRLRRALGLIPGR